MAGNSKGSADERPRALSRASLLARLAAIGIVIASVVAAFAYVGGWFSPHRLTPARFIDTFEKVNGIHPGFRRNHAKGVCVTGFFDSNGDGVRLSKAVVFRRGRVPVIGRFALAGGNPYAPDSSGTVRSMALLFREPNGEQWRTGMNNIPVFAVSTPKAFRLNAFRFIDAAGNSIPVRWSMVPAQPSAEAGAPRSASQDKNYLFDALISRINQPSQAPLQWHLIVTLGRPGDPTDDATIAWPDNREHVDVGTLTIDHIESEATGACRDVNYDPLVLPWGIAPSDDPLLSARSAAYSQSFRRRAGETKEPSAVTPAEIRQ